MMANFARQCLESVPAQVLHAARLDSTLTRLLRAFVFRLGRLPLLGPLRCFRLPVIVISSHNRTQQGAAITLPVVVERPGRSP